MKKYFKQFICLCLSVSMCTPVYAKNHSKNHQARYNISNTEIKKVEKNLKKEHKHNKGFGDSELKEDLESISQNEISYEEESDTVSSTLNQYFNTIEEYNDSSETFQSEDGYTFITETFVDENGNNNVRTYTDNYDYIYLTTFDKDNNMTYERSCYDSDSNKYTTEKFVINVDNSEIDSTVEMQGWGTKHITNWVLPGDEYWYQQDGNKVKIGCKATYIVYNINSGSKAGYWATYRDNVIDSESDFSSGLIMAGLTLTAVIATIIMEVIDFIATHGLLAASKRLVALVLASIGITIASAPAVKASEYFNKASKEKAKAASAYESLKLYGVKQ